LITPHTKSRISFCVDSSLFTRFRSTFLSAYDRAVFDVEEDVILRLGEDQTSEKIEIPLDEVVARASSMAYGECATYFELIRDSFRNVQLDIEKYREQQNLLQSDGFWRAFIEKAVASKKTENLLWDFKETLKMWHVPAEEKDRAKIVFAEDVAALANARGGVLVVGVTDRREVVGVGDARGLESRLKFAADVLAKHIEYDRELVSFHQVGLRDSGGTERICLAVVVAQAAGIVGVHDGQGHYTYPVRRETGISRESPYDASKGRGHIESDNRNFLRDLEQFVVGN